MRDWQGSLLCLSQLFFLSTPVFAAQDLGTLGGSYSFARDINQSGMIVGEASNAEGDVHAVLWMDNKISDLKTLTGHSFSMANGLNDLGQAVGYSRADAKSGQTFAVLWDQGKAIRLKGLRSEEYSQASEINNREEIVGVNGTKAIIWRKRVPKALPDLRGSFSIALGINNKSEIVGNCQTEAGSVHACAWIHDKVIDLGTLGGRFSTANAINDKSQIVGSSETKDGSIHAFVYEDGKMKDLGPGMIRNLNAEGSLAGEGPSAETNHSQLWSPEGRLQGLDKLPGALYSSAFGINDQGWVIGVSELDSEDSERSVFHATLWR